MKFSKLESKLYKFSIKFLPEIVIGCFIMGYFLYFAMPDIYMKLILNPYLMVENNEYWRLLTWIFTVPFDPDSALGIIFIPISLFFYYFVAKRLEMAWGMVMFNLYMIGGFLLIDISVLITALIKFKWAPSDDIWSFYTNILMSSAYGMSITYFTTMSMFLAFAVIYSEQVVMLYFMIPLKVKWLGYFDLAYLVYEFIKADDIFARVIIVSSVANFFIYFFINRKRNIRDNIENYKRRRDFQRRVKGANITGVYRGEGNNGGRTNTNQTPSGRPEPKKINPFNNNPPMGGMHRCAICGRTDADDDSLEFRYCSKCAGNMEYCMDHLYTHEHRK